MSDLFLNDYNLNQLERITTKRFGFDMFITPRFIGHYTNTPYEELTALMIRQCAKGVDTFIDVGAHYGFYDILVGLSNPQCNILAFEPVPENTQILQKNLELHSVHATVHQAAVSDHAGRDIFQISAASDNSGFTANPNAGILKEVEVEIVQLDQFIDQINVKRPVVVKIDTEGNEIKVIEGMKRCIQEIEDLRLIIEFNPECLEANGQTPQELLDILSQSGFDLFFIHDDILKYQKYRPNMDWTEIFLTKSYLNIYCVKKDRSLNLCLFSHSSTLEGAERSLSECVEGQIAKHGAVCTVILPDEGPLLGILEDSGAAILKASYHWWCAPVQPSFQDANLDVSSSYENLRKIFPEIQRISPDVILTNTLVIPWGAVAALELGLPHIWYVHEFGELDHGFDFYYTFQRSLEIIQESSNEIIANSEAVRKALFEGLNDHIHTIINSNISFSHPSMSTRSYFSDPNSLKLVITGRLTKPKGQDDAVHAVKKLIRMGYNIELCIVGGTDSPYADSLINLVQIEKLEDRIHFIGFTTDVRSIISQADIGLVCSRNEAFGRVTVEFLMMGKPVIGTNAGGTVELIDNEVDGLLYNPGNIDQLANKIAFFIDHPEKIREYGERAPELIHEILSKTSADDRLFQIGQGLKGKPNPISKQLLQLIIIWNRSFFETQNAAIQHSYEDSLKQKSDRLITSEATAIDQNKIIQNQELTINSLNRELDKLEVLKKDVMVQEENRQNLENTILTLTREVEASQAMLQQKLDQLETLEKMIRDQEEINRNQENTILTLNQEREERQAMLQQKLDKLEALEKESVDQEEKDRKQENTIQTLTLELRSMAQRVESLNQDISWMYVKNDNESRRKTFDFYREIKLLQDENDRRSAHQYFELKSELDGIYSSKVWKFAILFRKARYKLFPSASRRERMAKGIFSRVKAGRKNASNRNVTLKNRPQDVWGYIDTPQPDQQVIGIVQVFGWVVGRKKVLSVELLVDENVISKFLPGIDRPDVIKSFPDVADVNPFPGFLVDLNTFSIQDGKHKIVLQAITDLNKIRFAEIEVIIGNQCLPESGLKGCLEFPVNGQIVHEEIFISGWVGSSKPIQRIDILIDGKLVSAEIIRINRPDVLAQFPPTSLENPLPGFQTTIKNANQFANGIHKLAIEVTIENILETIASIDFVIEYQNKEKSSDGELISRVDSPIDGQIIKDWLYTKGWAIGIGGIDSINVVLDEGGSTIIADRFYFPNPTPDFDKFQEDNPLPGFSSLIDCRDLPSGIHKISFIAQSKEKINVIETRLIEKATKGDRILFISHDAGLTGAPILFLNILNWMKKNSEVSFEILLKRDGPLRADFEKLAPVKIWENEDPLSIIQYYLRREIGLIYSNTITNGDLIEILSQLNCPTLTHVHELKFWIENHESSIAIQKCIRNSDHFIVVSKAVKRYLVQSLMVDPTKIDLIYGFANFQSNKVDRQVKEIKKELNIPEDAFIVGGVGTMDWRKGVDIFILLSQEILKRYPDQKIYFIWVGNDITGKFLATSRFDLENMGIADYVHFVGEKMDVINYYNAFDVFVLPSREDPYPLVTLEAAKMGKPIVCFDMAGGASEFVENDCGFVVPYLDVHEMAEKVALLLNDPYLRNQMGERSKTKVAERHDMEKTVSKINEIVMQMLSNPE